MPKELVLPINLGLSKHKDNEISNIEKDLAVSTRLDLLNQIFKSGSNITKTTFKPNTVYKVAFGQTLQKGKDGFFRGVIYEEGKIFEHVKLEKIDFNVVDLLQKAGTQSLLLNISMQLADIQKSIQGIFTEFHNDRINELKATIQQFEQSEKMTKEERLHQIRLLLMPLKEGILKLITEIKTNIPKLQKIDNGFLSNWGKSSSGLANQLIPQIEESAVLVYRGIDVGIKSLIALNQPSVAISKFMGDCTDNLKDIDFQFIQEKSRYFNGKGKRFPEKTFKKISSLNKVLISELKEYDAISNNNDKLISIEFKSEEINLMKGE